MRLPSLFSDHMVMQRDIPVPVWGWAEAGDTITVEFIPGGDAGGRQVRRAKAGRDGRWMLHLDPLPCSSEPATLRIASSAEGAEAAVRDVLVGDVWLCSGQSNMEWPVAQAANPAAEIQGADRPGIRLFTVPRTVHEETPEDAGGAWARCSPSTVENFSAVGYFFGRELHACERAPIGLLNSSWGGTRVEAWMSSRALYRDPAARREAQGHDQLMAGGEPERRRKAMAEFQASPAQWFRMHVAPDPGNRGAERGWHTRGCDDSAWPEMNLPDVWQRQGVDGNGVVWFRRRVEVPAAWAGRDLLLRIGACDKHDVTYFNGEQVGATGWETESPWMVTREYRVPGRLAKAGPAAIAVRVYSYRNMGGMTGPADSMRLSVAGAAGGDGLPLAGRWRYAVEYDFGVIRGTPGEAEPFPNQNSPHALFDAMVAPLAPFAIRGVIWYQGESNSENPARYRRLFPAMIRDWRETWRQGDLPFLFVQLAGYRVVGKPDGWIELREAQAAALAAPNTGMAVAMDIGDPLDVHPKNKQEVGRRLALAARALAYGREVAGSGPVYRAHRIEAGSVRISFDHVHGGLVAGGGAPLRGFEIAGADRRFAAAEAAIEGDTVVVRAAPASRPEAVRYAWRDLPDCNLLNAAGLPAAPFRTDPPAD